MLKMKGTLHEKQCTFPPVSLLPLHVIAARFKSETLHTFGTDIISLIVTGLKLRTIYMKTNICFRLYLGSHWKDVSENLCLGRNTLSLRIFAFHCDRSNINVN